MGHGECRSAMRALLLVVATVLAATAEGIENADLSPAPIDLGSSMFKDKMTVTLHQAMDVDAVGEPTREVEQLMDSNVDSHGRLMDDFNIRLGDARFLKKPTKEKKKVLKIEDKVAKKDMKADKKIEKANVKAEKEVDKVRKAAKTPPKVKAAKENAKASKEAVLDAQKDVAKAAGKKATEAAKAVV